MMNLFGSRALPEAEAMDTPSKKLTRFRNEHVRAQIPQRRTSLGSLRAFTEDHARPQTPQPAQTATVTPISETAADPVDELHSEVGLNPGILRNALPMRFQKLDEKTASPLSAEAFGLKAAGH